VNGTWSARGARGMLAASALWLLGGCGYDNGSGNSAPLTPTTTTGGVTSTAKGSGGEGPYLMFISNSNSDWWSAVEKGMTDGGKKFGARVELRRNDGQPEGQIKLLEDALSLPDVKGVAVSVLEAESPGIADKMKALTKAGKIVIAIDSDGQADARRAYIGTNNRKAGEAAGKAAAQLRPQGGKTAVFVGTAAAANAIERREGFFLGAGKPFEQLEVFEDGGDLTRASSNVQTALSKYADVGVLLGLWSYNAPRIAEEVTKSPEQQKKITVVTFDLDEQAVDLIEKGTIQASVCQNPYEMGYQGVRLLKALVENDDKTVNEMLPDKANPVIDTGVRVIVPAKTTPVKGDNVIDIKAMKEWLTSKGLRSS
jgi:ribose transport system substrate-binding protein